MKKFYPAFIVISALGLLMFHHLGESAVTELGPHGGAVVSTGDQKVEVSIEPSNKRVQLYVLNHTKVFPGVIGMKLRNAEGQETTFELKMTTPAVDPLEYSSSLDIGVQPFVGFELRIPFQKEQPVLIRSALPNLPGNP
jgi:hypothetical protein